MEGAEVSELVRTLRQRVDQRRASGEYPPGLEAQLETGFAVVMDQVRVHQGGTAELLALASVVRDREPAIDVGARAGASRLPLGSVLHRAIGRSATRQISPVADGLRMLRIDVADALDEVRRLIETQRGADERVLNDVIGGVVDRLSVIDGLAAAVEQLERRVGALETSSTDSGS